MSDDDQLSRLERSMSAMRPKAIPADLLAELVDEMNHDDRRQRSGDRLLLTAIGSGVAAAVVIASMLFLQSVTEPNPLSPSPVLATTSPPRAGDYLAFFPHHDGVFIK